MARASNDPNELSPQPDPQGSNPSDDDLERYCLGMILDESKLAPLEEHLLACANCAGRADETQRYVNAIRATARNLSKVPDQFRR